MERTIPQAVEERDILKNIVDGAKPTGTVGGQGGVDFPKTAIKDEVY